jgi:hypothetical protein
MTRLFFSVRSIRARRDLTRDQKIRKRLGAEGAQSGAGVAPLRSPFFFPPPRAQEAQAVEPNRRRATPKKKKIADRNSTPLIASHNQTYLCESYRTALEIC